MSRGIAEANLLADIHPNFTWVRLAQRVPVRIAFGPITPGVRLVAGLTATVTVIPSSEKK